MYAESIEDETDHDEDITWETIEDEPDGNDLFPPDYEGPVRGKYLLPISSISEHASTLKYLALHDSKQGYVLPGHGKRLQSQMEILLTPLKLREVSICMYLFVSFRTPSP